MMAVRLHRDREGGCGVVGAPEHQQLAYEAASQSLVLLKNNAGTLPLSAKSPVRQKPTTQTISPLYFICILSRHRRHNVESLLSLRLQPKIALLFVSVR